MKQMSENLLNTSYYEVENNTTLKTPRPRKPHRKVLSGLRLLGESCKTARPCSNVRVTEVHVDRNDEETDILKQQSELPHDILMHQILARIPIKTLLKSKSVSKDWYSTVSSNEFANLHFKTCFSSNLPSSPIEFLLIQATNSFYLFHLQEEETVLDYNLVKLEPNFDYNHQNELHLVGSCNGLVCLSDSFTGHFYIWNPIVYHWQKFSDLCLCSYNYHTSWGFGYVSSTNDYKVVKIAENYDTREIVVFVFSLKTKKWRQIHDHGLDVCVSLTKTNPGVLVNETLFWIKATRDNPSKKHTVFGFNVASEKFEEIPGFIPSNRTFRGQFLCVMGGCLSLCSSNMHKETYLSILKRAGEIESVSLSSSSDSWPCSSLVGFTRTGKCLVVSKDSELALIDLNSSPRQCFPLLTFEEAQKPCMVSFFPSLISPFVI